MRTFADGHGRAVSIHRHMTGVGSLPMANLAAVIVNLEAEYGGANLLADALNAQIRELEAGRPNGVPSRSTISDRTIRAWKAGRTVKFPVVLHALAILAGQSPDELRGERVITEAVDRREFLQLAGGAAALSALGPLLSSHGPRPLELDLYERQAWDLWRAASVANPLALCYDAQEHAQRGASALETSSGRDRERIAVAAAMTTTLAGRLAFFDLGDVTLAQRAWVSAETLLQSTSDHSFLACVLGHQAFVPGWGQRWGEADRLLWRSAKHASRSGPGLRTWVRAVRAECLAVCERYEPAIEEGRLARDTLAAGGTQPDPEWLDFFDAAMLDGFDAFTALAAARPVLDARSMAVTARVERTATGRVERALTLLRTSSDDPAEFTPQDCVTVLDQAVGSALLHDDERSLLLAEVGCQALSRRQYKAATSRLDTLGAVLPSSNAKRLYEIELAYPIAV